MTEKREGDLAGKHRDMGIKTVEGQDREGHLKGSQQSRFNEKKAQERQQGEDSSSELNRKDARDDMRGGL